MTKGLDHVCFTVSDMDRSLDFYRLLFNSEPLSDGRESSKHAATVIGYDPIDLRFAWFAIPGTETFLELFEFIQPRTQAGNLENYNVGNGHLGLIVDDLDAEYHRLSEAGAKFASHEPVEIRAGSWQGSKVIYMRDPDGITIELMESPPGPESRFGNAP
jgi:catechol 2,3-dioxygenase-like lactoylglutathione lyase family enzyme